MAGDGLAVDVVTSMAAVEDAPIVSMRICRREEILACSAVDDDDDFVIEHGRNANVAPVMEEEMMVATTMMRIMMFNASVLSIFRYEREIESRLL